MKKPKNKITPVKDLFDKSLELTKYMIDKQNLTVEESILTLHIALDAMQNTKIMMMLDSKKEKEENNYVG